MSSLSRLAFGEPLEPVVREAVPAAPVLRRLKQVQQLLGDLHDLQVVIVRLGDAAAEAAAERTRRLHHQAVGGDRGAAARGPRPATSGQPIASTP